MVYGNIGTFSLLAGLAFAVFGSLAGPLAARRGDARLEEVARRAAVPVFVLVLVAMLALWAALLANDTTVSYVANKSSSLSPLWVKLVTLWAALEGSILLWAFVLASYGLVLSRVAAPGPLRPWALAVVYVTTAFFLGVIVAVANPFAIVPDPPADGPGPNALLQNHWLMSVHPVLMYLGLVGMTVPFAYAIAALVTGRVGDAWIKATWRWSLSGWLFLSLANVVGGLWSYEVLGWGGYWGWDPVENVALVPWLLATAFLHSVQVQERRRMLKVWNLGLIVATFASSILATFIIRSGIISSVHSFGRGPVGPAFLGFFAVVFLGSLALAWWRLPYLRDENELDHPLSREAAFLANNVLFVVFAFATLLGTLFPVFVELANGARVSVGAPFFNSFAIPLGWAILLLMGVGPALPLRHGPSRRVWRSLAGPLLAGLVAATLGYVFGLRRLTAVVMLGLFAYNLASVLVMIAVPARARARASGKSALLAVPELARENPRRFGSHVVHVGIAVIALGVAISGGYKFERELTLDRGQVKDVSGRRVQFVEMLQGDRPDKRIVAARLLVDGREEFLPRLNYYRSQQQPVGTPAIRYGLIGDTYIVLIAFDPQARWVSIRYITSPLVTWIWIGGLVLLLGTGLSLTPAWRPSLAPLGRQAQAAP